MKKSKSKKAKSPYTIAKLALRELQKKLGKPPKRASIPELVDQLVKDSGLRKDSLENYFRLYAMNALLNKEALCRYWRG